jgi:hypothetical protein
VVEQLTVFDVPCADPLTHWLTRVSGAAGVEKVKLAEVAVPAESVERTA